MLSKGNAVRIQEILSDEGISIHYSTLNRIIQQQNLRVPVKRSGIYDYKPGAEMQHDTSPHTVEIGGKKIKTQCAALILPFSRFCFIQYYPNFTRFEAKAFLTDGLIFFQGSCPRCTIDNTSVLVASGSGPDAVITAEMRYLGGYYKMRFIPHAIGHADRKAHVERLFLWVETNFLAGRVFNDWSDLNHQAIAWCQHCANAKIKRALGDTPEAVFNRVERNQLIPLPAVPLPVYQTEHRIVDSQGYIHLDSNRYSVPERLIDKAVEVLKYMTKVVIYFNHDKVAEHQRLIGVREKRSTDKAHHPPLKKRRSAGPSKYETQLRGVDPILDVYLDQLIKRSPGRGVTKLKRLLRLKRDYPQASLLAGIAQATQYGLFDLTRVENLILKHIGGDFFNLEID